MAAAETAETRAKTEQALLKQTLALLVQHVNATGKDAMAFEVDGITEEGKELGKWQIIVNKKS